MIETQNMNSLNNGITVQTALKGASAPAFENHRGYQRMFRQDALSLGIFLPLRFYRGNMQVLAGQSALVGQLDRAGFAAVWVRDVPLFDPMFGDAGQVFGPFTYLAFLAAQTEHIALATGSAIFSLRHPIDLAKSATTIDQLSGGRLVMGVASGDRPVEFPAYGIEHAQRAERFADAVNYVRGLMQPGMVNINSRLGSAQGVELLPKPVAGAVPLLVTGTSRQSLPWVAEHADGWLTYPDATHHAAGPKRLAEKIRAWRGLIEDGGFRPHVTNEWIDLMEDPNHPRTAIDGGYTLRTGRNGLIDLLGEWQRAGVNHAALGIQFSQRSPQDVLQELSEYVLPLFPAHDAPKRPAIRW